MIRLRFVPGGVLSSMTGALLPPLPALDAVTRQRVRDDVCRFVAGQVDAMPGFLGVPFGLALLAFDLLSIVRHGRRFGALAPGMRARYLATWDDAPFAPMRNVIKLVRSCTLLAFYDHPAVAEGIRSPARCDRSAAAAGDHPGA